MPVLNKHAGSNENGGALCSKPADETDAGCYHHCRAVSRQHALEEQRNVCRLLQQGKCSQNDEIVGNAVRVWLQGRKSGRQCMAQ